MVSPPPSSPRTSPFLAKYRVLAGNVANGHRSTAPEIGLCLHVRGFGSGRSDEEGWAKGTLARRGVLGAETQIFCTFGANLRLSPPNGVVPVKTPKLHNRESLMGEGIRSKR